MSTMNTSAWLWLLAPAFALPWLVGVVYFWRHRARDGALPLSMADAARQRLWPR